MKESLKRISNYKNLQKNSHVLAQKMSALMQRFQDLMLFVQIAKALHITVRFAGEEPLDRFTRMYNDNMRAILPKYGIAFEAIARKESDGEVISASRVRAALKSKDWETIQKIVPKTTYCYLQEKFG